MTQLEHQSNAERAAVLHVLTPCRFGSPQPGGPTPLFSTYLNVADTSIERGLRPDGPVGYFGLGGAADLNIVIRTAVRCGDGITVGAGGTGEALIKLDSITLDS